MDKSIFEDKANVPSDIDLKTAIGDKYTLWQEIRNYVLKKYPNAFEEWNFPGAKYGWSFRIKDKKRAILYFLPRKDSFMVAFVFGNKAYSAIQVSDIAEQIKKDLAASKVYAEGRGIRINVTGNETVNDIRKLIDIKLAN